MIDVIRRTDMSADQSTSATAERSSGSPDDARTPGPPPPVPPAWRADEAIPSPPVGVYLGLACFGSLAAACTLLFTPWLNLFFPVFLAAVPLGAAGIASAHRDSRRRGLIVSTVGTTIAGVLLVQALLLIVLVARNGFGD
jgi:hypothetical protein